MWYSIRPTHDFQAVKFGGSKGGPGANAANWGSSWCHVHGAKAGCRALEDAGYSSDKEGEPKASGYSCHRQSFETGGGYWTRSVLEKLHFHERSEGNGTSQCNTSSNRCFRLSILHPVGSTHVQSPLG